MEQSSSQSISSPIQIHSTILDHWIDNLAILVCVVKPEQGQSQVKEISSTKGMQLSLQNSELMQLARLGHDLPEQHI